MKEIDKYSFNGIPKTTKFGQSRKNKWHKKYINRFLRDIPDNCSVLEVGPGRGEFAIESHRRNWQYLGVESSDKMIEILQSKRINVIKTRVPPIPVKDNCFSLIHANQVIEHFQNIREFTFFMEECWRVLKPKGYLSLSCPNYLTQGKLFFNWDYTHRLTFTKYNLERACKDYDFKISQSLCHNSHILSGNIIAILLRYLMIWLAKGINLPILLEITDKVSFLRTVRL